MLGPDLDLLGRTACGRRCGRRELTFSFRKFDRPWVSLSEPTGSGSPARIPIDLRGHAVVVGLEGDDRTTWPVGRPTDRSDRTTAEANDLDQPQTPRRRPERGRASALLIHSLLVPPVGDFGHYVEIPPGV